MKDEYRTDYEEFAGISEENRKLLRQEELILDATEGLASLMERQGITKADLARRLGRSRGYITQILAGSRNFTLRTLAEVANALGYRVHLSFDADPEEGVRSQESGVRKKETGAEGSSFRVPGFQIRNPESGI
ncbi:MAG: helix-turn-helix transcriptional regulator [Acidobacteriota bacterium]